MGVLEETLNTLDTRPIWIDDYYFVNSNGMILIELGVIEGFDNEDRVIIYVMVESEPRSVSVKGLAFELRTHRICSTSA